MNSWVMENWPALLIGLLLVTIALWWLLAASRRTRVDLDRRDTLDAGAGPAARNQALIDAPPVGAQSPLPPIVPEAVGAAGVAVAAAAQDAEEDRGDGAELTRIKGLGPKLAATLHGLGVTRIDQIAAWSDADIDRIDAQLGRFQGRIRRDEWVEQARLLASGEEEKFNARFGSV
jgi:predicted flap endonuclease-1-like 5' DNA nuclease